MGNLIGDPMRLNPREDLILAMVGMRASGYGRTGTAVAEDLAGIVTAWDGVAAGGG
jgi:hypothetical protein